MGANRMKNPLVSNSSFNASRGIIFLLFAVLACGYMLGSPAMSQVDHDSDDDGLIEITSSEQLDAIRWDLDGDGTPESNTTKYTEQFPSVSEHCPVDGCIGYELVSDIDYTDHSYISGTFTGTFDGNNYTISNAIVTDSDVTTNDVGGIFSILNGEVRNLHLADVYVQHDTVATTTGGLVGKLLLGGNITNVHVNSGTVNSSATQTGGLVGNSTGTIHTSTTNTTVLGVGYTGGLVGYSNGEIKLSNATSYVSSTGKYTGGLVGYSDSAQIRKSYAGGANVSSTGEYTGGLVGYLNGGGITRSNAANFVYGTDYTGGLVGYHDAW